MSQSLGGRVAGFTVLGLLLVAGAVWVGGCLVAGDRAPRHASVEGVSIAGLAPGSAEAKLRSALAERSREQIGVSYGDGRSVAVDPQEAGLAVDYRASVLAAGGGTGFGPRRVWEVISGGGDHRAEVTVDQSRMQATLDHLGSGIDQRPVEGTVLFDEGRAVPVYGRPGRVVSRSATQRFLERRFLHGGSRKLATEVRAPVVTDGAVRRALRDFGRPAMSGPVTLVLGGHRVVAPPRLFGRGLSMRAVDETLVPQVDGEVLLEALTPVLHSIAREPQDARIVVRGGTPRVVPAKVGVEVDPAALERAFADVVVQHGAQRRLALPGKVTPPTFGTAAAQALKVTERVGRFTTRFPYAEYRNVNLTRAAQLVDGTLLRPGQTFSLNEVVGRRSRDNGFTEGYVITHGLFTKDVGGGVSQLASTLFNATFLAGLREAEHTPRSVYDDRYPPGRDAAVSWPGVDLSFTDDTPYGVLLTARVRPSAPGREGTVTVSVYSTRAWRVTVGHGPRTHVTRPRVRRLHDTACQDSAGSPGFGIDVFRVLRRPGSGKVQRRERLHTDYAAADTVRCGAAPEPEHD